MRDELLRPEPTDDDLAVEPTLGAPARGPHAGIDGPVADPLIGGGDDTGLRPTRLAEFVGQGELKEHLGIILEAARPTSICPAGSIVLISV